MSIDSVAESDTLTAVVNVVSKSLNDTTADNFVASINKGNDTQPTIGLA